MNTVYTPTTPGAFNTLSAVVRRKVLFDLQGLRNRSPGFCFGGCTVDFWFDDELDICYIESRGNAFNLILAFSAKAAEKMLNKWIAEFKAWADEEGRTFGDEYRFTSYDNAASHLLTTLPTNEVPKTMRSTVAWWKEERRWANYWEERRRSY